MLRVLNRLPQLRLIVAAIPGIGAIGGLMSLRLLRGAVMATSLFDEDFPDWFGSIGKSLCTLFQVMTLESWSMGIVRPVMEVRLAAWLFFVVFTLVAVRALGR